MNWSLLWFVLAGAILGFALSTLWEWLYFRPKRLSLIDERIAELEAELHDCRERARDPLGISGYADGGARLETEVLESLSDTEPSSEEAEFGEKARGTEDEAAAPQVSGSASSSEARASEAGADPADSAEEAEPVDVAVDEDEEDGSTSTPNEIERSVEASGSEPDAAGVATEQESEPDEPLADEDQEAAQGDEAASPHGAIDPSEAEPAAGTGTAATASEEESAPDDSPPENEEPGRFES